MIVTITLNCAIDRVVYVENLGLDKINRGQLASSLPGGKGLNVARTLKVLNEPVLAWGFIGGKNGRFIEESLEKEEILSDFIHIEEESRLCNTYIDRQVGTLTEINEQGPAIPMAAMAGLFKQLEHLPASTEAIVFSGSLPKGVPDNIYAHLLQLVPHPGILTVLDAKGAALRAGLEAKPHIVKPNRHEAEDLWKLRINSERRVHEVLDRFLDAGVIIVALSLDQEGAYVASSRERWHIQAPKIRPVNTVGCGDAFTAGLVKGMLYFDGELSRAACLAVACGTANALVQGAGRCHLEDIQALMEDIQATPL